MNWLLREVAEKSSRDKPDRGEPLWWPYLTGAVVVIVVVQHH